MYLLPSALFYQWYKSIKISSQIRNNDEPNRQLNNFLEQPGFKSVLFQTLSHIAIFLFTLVLVILVINKLVAGNS